MRVCVYKKRNILNSKKDLVDTHTQTHTEQDNIYEQRVGGG